MFFHNEVFILLMMRERVELDTGETEEMSCVTRFTVSGGLADTLHMARRTFSRMPSAGMAGCSGTASVFR